MLHGIIYSDDWVGTPPSGRTKSDIDGSYNAGTDMASAGGIIRNSDGLWVCGFVINSGYGSITTAELWGLFEGLQLAWKKGCLGESSWKWIIRVGFGCWGG